MNIKEEFERVSHNFSENLQSVEDLLEFDQAILQLCLSHLGDLEMELKKHGFDNPYLSVNKTIQALKNIKEHRSTKIKYRTISNQCLVLAVSHFASAIHDLFKVCINYAFENDLSEELNNEEFKFTVKELAELGSNINERIGELISENKSISFQDMKSISRSFKDYFNYEIDKNINVNNIIFGQACRHAIVHSGARVDQSLLRQVKAADPNHLDMELVKDEGIYFKSDQLRIVIESMGVYLKDLMSGLENHWGVTE